MRGCRFVVPHEPHDLLPDALRLERACAHFGVVQQQVYPFHPRAWLHGTANRIHGRGSEPLEEYDECPGDEGDPAALSDVMQHTRQDHRMGSSRSSKLLCYGEKVMLIVRRQPVPARDHLGRKLHRIPRR